MTELSRTLIGRGLVQSLSRSSLRTQGPITPGLESKKGLCSSAEARVRAVWVPAFAGTTCWKIPYAIALPLAGGGSGWGPPRAPLWQSSPPPHRAFDLAVRLVGRQEDVVVVVEPKRR